MPDSIPKPPRRHVRTGFHGILSEMPTELIELTQRLLDAIASRDWEAYVQLCEPGVTCFEPEARGVLVEGLEFHRFYFVGQRSDQRRSEHLIDPRIIQLAPDAAAVVYIRLTQVEGGGTQRHEETRIWRRTEGAWRLAHLHRSANP